MKTAKFSIAASGIIKTASRILVDKRDISSNPRGVELGGIASGLAAHQLIERELRTAFRAARFGQAGEVVAAGRTDNRFQAGAADALSALGLVLAPDKGRQRQPDQRHRRQSTEQAAGEILIHSNEPAD